MDNQSTRILTFHWWFFDNFLKNLDFLFWLRSSCFDLRSWMKVNWCWFNIFFFELCWIWSLEFYILYHFLLLMITRRLNNLSQLVSNRTISKIILLNFLFLLLSLNRFFKDNFLVFWCFLRWRSSSRRWTVTSSKDVILNHSKSSWINFPFLIHFLSRLSLGLRLSRVDLP